MHTEDLVRIADAHHEVQRLYELTHEVGNSLSLDETLAVLATRLRDLVRHDFIAIFLLEKDRLMPALVQGENARMFACHEPTLGQGPIGGAVAARKAVCNGDPREEVELTALNSMLILPLEGPAGSAGAIVLGSIEAGAFTPEHLRLLQAVQDKLSLAVENALRFKQAVQNATIDPLTALPNARAAFLELDREIARCRRSGAWLAVISMDIEGFRRVNERFGQILGNVLLQRLAAEIREHCREYDYIARMGGDEFVILLPEFAREGLQSKLDAFTEAVPSVCEEVCGESFLRCNLGYALFPEDGIDADSLLARADARLFEAKQSHRRTILAGTLPPQPYAV